MKIVHVTDDLSPSNTGISSAIRELARAALAAGHSVAAVTVGSVAEPSVPNFSIHSVACKGAGSVWRYAPDFDTELLEAVGDDTVIHLHGMWMYPQWRAAKLALERNWPVVVSPHNMLGGWLWQRGWLRRMKKRMYFDLMLRNTFSRVGAIHALSALERSVLASDYFSESRIVSIQNALDLVSLDTQMAKIITKVSEDERYILFLGRIHPVKGIDLLINAVSKLESKQRFKLILAGPPSVPEYERQLKEQVETLGLGHCVSFVGSVYGDEKWQLLSGAWIFCAPSYSEGMSMAALEAMATGVPVITTHGAGLDDVEQAGGFLVDTNPTEICRAIEAALEWNLSERKERGLRGRRIVEQNYSWPAVWPKYEALYASLLK